MPETKTPPKGKGKGLLAKKVGPIPVVALVAVAGLLLLLLWRKNKQGSSATGIDTTSTVTPTANLTPQQASSAGATSPSFDPSSLSGLFTTPPDYVTQTDLNSQLDSLSGNVASQIAAITYPNPNITVNVPPPSGTVTQDKPPQAPQRKATTKVASTPTKFFTYKKNVVLSHGQTLHFKKGKGYYAS